MKDFRQSQNNRFVAKTMGWEEAPSFQQEESLSPARSVSPSKPNLLPLFGYCYLGISRWLPCLVDMHMSNCLRAPLKQIEYGFGYFIKKIPIHPIFYPQSLNPKLQTLNPIFYLLKGTRLIPLYIIPCITSV